MKTNRIIRVFTSTEVEAKPQSGFTILELLVVIALIGLIASAILAALTNAQMDARDKRRISDLKQVANALELYYTRYNTYPTEASGANGNISTNATFRTMLGSYLPAVPVDPTGPGNATFYYYYDGSHNCGGRDQVVIFARQMDKAANSNYSEFLDTTCAGSVDGEGRGGGTQSYNLIIGAATD